MSDQSNDALRAEDAADAAASDPEAAAAAAQPSEERLNEASPDDAAGAAGRPDADAPAADGAAASEGTAGGDGDGEGDPAAPGGDAADFRDQYMRAVAELDNVRKRLTRQATLAEARGIAKLAKEVLPAVDDLERALEVAPEDDPMRDGVRIVHERLLGALARLGIEADAPRGEPFDPHRHEAIAQQPVEGAASGTIVEVYSNGYRLGDDVLRAAKVVVAA